MAIKDSFTPDIIIISMGTNDPKHLFNYGNLDATTQGNITYNTKITDLNDTYAIALAKGNEDLVLTKLYHALKYNLLTIKEKYPNAKCFITTPI